MNKGFIKKICLAVCLLSLSALSISQLNQIETLPPAQSKTGPFPPLGIDLSGHLFDRFHFLAATAISGVPAYIWRHGCGPTAVGMVIGYYDLHGFPELIAGEPDIQGDLVNSAIASIENYYDYCLPIDYHPNLLPDKSEPPFGDEHQDNCIADYMKTSQSYYKNYYGWSWDLDVKSAFESYVSSVSNYSAVATKYGFSNFSWDSLKNEINNNKPLVLLVDTDGNGEADHFITVIGYNSEGGVDYYGCYSTWDRIIHWYIYRTIASGARWGVYSITTFYLVPELYPPKNFELKRLVNDLIFFKEYINRLSWEANEKNGAISLKYRLFRKKKGASDITYQLLVELGEKTLSYDDRGLKKDDLFTYRIMSVDLKGKESDSIEVSN